MTNLGFRMIEHHCRIGGHVSILETWPWKFVWYSFHDLKLTSRRHPQIDESEFRNWRDMYIRYPTLPETDAVDNCLLEKSYLKLDEFWWVLLRVHIPSWTQIRKMWNVLNMMSWIYHCVREGIWHDFLQVSQRASTSVSALCIFFASGQSVFLFGMQF